MEGPGSGELRQVLRLEAGTGGKVALLRGVPGLEVAASVAGVWIRGDFRGQEMCLASLPVVGLYEELAEGGLSAVGGGVPIDSLPDDLEWLPIQQAVQLRKTIGGMPGQQTAGVQVRLHRSEQEAEAGLLECHLADLEEWVTNAPEIRYEGMEYALSEDGTGLVKGPMIPPIRGRRYVLTGSVAIPSGFRLEPDLPGSVIRELIGAGSGTTIVFDQAGCVSVIDAGCFVPVSRAGLRDAMRERGENGPT